MTAEPTAAANRRNAVLANTSFTHLAGATMGAHYQTITKALEIRGPRASTEFETVT